MTTNRRGRAALLLVDPSTGTVVRANAVAGQLAPEAVPPVALAVWWSAAGLAAIGAAGASVLDLMRLDAAVELVTTRSSAVTDAGEGLWMSTLPMDDADDTDPHPMLIILRPVGRFALLPDFTDRVADIRDPDRVIEMTARLLTPGLASISAIYTVDAYGQLRQPLLVHEREYSDPRIAHIMTSLRQADLVRPLTSAGGLRRALSGEDDVVMFETGAHPLPDPIGSLPGMPDGPVAALGLHSSMAVALRSRDAVIGAIFVGNDERRARFAEDDVVLVREIAARAGLIVDNARLYEREHIAAEILQRNLLPTLPSVEGLEFAAAYLPVAAQAAIGGDWYDVVAMRSRDDPARSVGIVVGDVMGHDYESAARMGRLSSVMRTLCWDGSAPADVLDDTDACVADTDLDVLATCLCVMVRLDGDGASIAVASAGHPPPLLRSADGTVEVVDVRTSPMIGIARTLGPLPRRQTSPARPVAPGTTLVCVTDGILESLGERDSEVGLRVLSELVARLPPDARPARIADAITASVTARTDDLTVLAIRIE